MAQFSRPGWLAKFKNAILGIGKGIDGQNSFWVHIPVALAVVALAIALHLNAIEFSILLLCVGAVIACELFNSAIEFLAKSITDSYDPRIGSALDTASGAVLIMAITAATVGVIIVFSHLQDLFF